MSEKVLRPILHRTAYNRALERELIDWLREAVFTPLLLVLKEYEIPTRENDAGSALIAALKAGTVIYTDGQFAGQFNAAISRELRELGAEFDSRSKTFRLAHDHLPYYLRGAIAEALSVSTEIHTALLSTLAAIGEHLPKAEPALPVTLLAGIFADLEKQFHGSVEIVEGLGLPFEFTASDRERMTEELTENLELGIKGFVADRLPTLRHMVEENLARGGRTDLLAKKLQAEFGFAQRKAEFLADHETGLLVSKYRQHRYESLGVQEYIWSTSNDERVRPDHKALNGRRFSFMNPPIVDRATGRRGNPGEDYRCRCVAQPILNLVSA